jgi:hypothetical protein
VFLNTKKKIIETICEKLFKLKSQGKSIKYIPCDNGGKNRGLINRNQGADCKIPVQFEFIGRDTP